MLLTHIFKVTFYLINISNHNDIKLGKLTIEEGLSHLGERVSIKAGRIPYLHRDPTKPVVSNSNLVTFFSTLNI